MYSGIAASEGVAIGKALVLKKLDAPPPEHLPAELIEAEIVRFAAAVAAARDELTALAADVTAKVGADEGAIFEAHALLLADDELRLGVEEKIRAGKTAVWSLQATLAAYRELFAGLDDPYLRERAGDLDDLARRLTACLAGGAPAAAEAGEPVVVVAHELTPSETARLDPAATLGFVTATGGKTSHTAIMARSMGIPAVLGVAGIAETVRDGDLIILDGGRGLVAVNPDPATLDAYTARAAARTSPADDGPAVTRDGCRLALWANIGRPADVAQALRFGAEGIGLFRSEFLFMDRAALPDEQEQYAAYRQVAEAVGGRPVIIRTLDIGGDKPLPALGQPGEANPFLGLRAIRLCFAHPALFRTQLRAILRASAHGDVRLMYPMIAAVGEITRANALLAECKAELAAGGLAHNSALPVGIMVEVPAVAAAADIFARHSDFFSLGTNDLTQYALAVDRMNETLGHLYQPLDPGVLRLISTVAAAARAAGKPAGICGELAADPVAAVLLLGLGLDELSASPASLPAVRRLVRAVTLADARRLANEALALDSAAAVRERVEAYLREIKFAI
ncbi:MAG: phosphoenolpyruvate--protein phosphotransferase [Sporomusaceae bacterium]|nr:phosphoenolpyruvate--protein phosphotransferase [Sporomusaceae bacterium]